MAKIKALRWTGTAQVAMTPEPLDLIIETRVEPFGRAWTSSYRKGESPDRARRLRIQGTKAFVLREDVETGLPPAQARHEREQYALYGYLLEMLISEKLNGYESPYHQDYPILREHPGLPSILFLVGPPGRRIANASYTVHKPQGRGMIAQKITFSGQMESDGLRWPKQIEIAQNRKPYFKLVLESFTIEPA